MVIFYIKNMDTLVCFICHFIDENVIERYNIIKNGLLDGYDIKFVIPTKTNENNFNDYEDSIDFIFLNLEKNIFLNCKNNNNTRNELIYCNIYKQFPDFKNYYFIEYDIIFGENTSENWNNLFNEYNNDDIDLLCCHLNKYDLNYIQSNYPIAKIIYMNTNDDNVCIKDNLIIDKYGNIIGNNIYFGFFPLCKFSNKLIKLIYDYYFIEHINTYTFFEYLIPSICKKNNLNAVDFSHKFTQFIDYINDNIHYKVNCGSVSWYTENKNKYEGTKLIYPVNIDNNILDKTISIYQIYHKKELKKFLLENKDKNYHSFYTKEVLDCDNINHLQDLLNEFVCQYYVYKNNIKSDIIGFCQYGKYFSNNNNFTYGNENHLFNKEILKVNNLDNKVIGISTYFNNNISPIITFTNHNNNFYNLLYNYIVNKYPDQKERFLNLSNNLTNNYFIRFESFICKWDDFCKYMEFMLGLFEFYGLKINKNTNINDLYDKIEFFIIDQYKDMHWYKNNHMRFIAYFIELTCGIYWHLFGYNIIHNFKPKE